MKVDTLGTRLIDAAERHQNRLALWIGGTEYSYRDLFDTACTLAAELDRTTPADAPIGILGQQTFSAYVGVLASLLCGRPFAPVNPHEPHDRQHVMLQIVKPGALVCDAASLTSAERHGAELGCDPGIFITDGPARVRRLPDSILPLTPLEGFSPTATPDSSAYILFTSGTTGQPKGVRMCHRNVVPYLDAVEKFAPLTPEDRVTQLFALTFDPIVHDLFVTWAAGASVWLMLAEDALNRLAFVRKHKITCWYSVPVTAANANRMGQLVPNSVPSLRYSSFCGEALPTSVVQAWQAACPNSAVFNLYGPTEAGAITYARYQPNSAMDDSLTIPIGQANHGQFAIVVDANGVPVAPGEEGELMLGGPQVGPGYINNPEANSRRFFEADIGGSGPQRWYRSGDWVLNDPEIGLVFKHRVDDQLKVGGYRVEMQEVEEILRRASETSTVAVVPWRENGIGGADALVGFLAGCDVSHAEVIRRCRELLPKPVVPRKLIDVAELPTNKNGKVDRKVLKALLGQRIVETLEAAPKRKIA